MRYLQAFFALLLPVALIYVGALWSNQRSRAIIDRWAKKNGFEVISAESRLFKAGPFTFWRGKAQTVYRVRIRDANGGERNGWVRCGGWFMGLVSDDVAVRWE